MSRLSLGEVEIYYEVHGAGAPLLGVHGTPSSAVLCSSCSRPSWQAEGHAGT
jgi:hypothetical protein